MKKFLSTLIATVLLCPLFAQEYEASVQIVFLKEADSIMKNFSSDISNKQLISNVADKITKYEIKRFKAPYGNQPLESIINNNRKATISESERIAKIYYKHPTQAMANRLANLIAREYIEFQKLSLYSEKFDEVASIESQIAKIEPELDKLDKAAAFISSSSSQGKGVSMDKAASTLRQREELTEKRNKLNNRKNKILREIKQAQVPVIIRN